AGAIFGAFRGLLPPDEVMASSNDVLPAIVFSGKHRRSGRAYVYLETLGGGAGARLGRDGMDGVQVHVTNTSNLPIEALENEYPLLVEEYGFVPGSGGAHVARRAGYRKADPRARRRHCVRLPQRLASDRGRGRARRRTRQARAARAQSGPR